MRLGGLRKPGVWALVATVAVAALVLLPRIAPAATKRITGTCASGTCRWKPRWQSITKGNKIVWRVPSDGVTHTVTAYRARGSKEWAKNVTLDPGEKTGKVFRRAGTYRFKCTIHPSTMKGYVKVT
jgi:plastocyanin